MYAVFEHLYSVQIRAGPLLEYCVCKGTVRGFFTGGYTECACFSPGPDGSQSLDIISWTTLERSCFTRAVRAAALAKSMDRKIRRTWGWIGAPRSLWQGHGRNCWRCPPNAEIILTGDALEQLRHLPPESVHTCVTSPPYYNLRDYGAAGQIETRPAGGIPAIAGFPFSVRSAGSAG